MSKKLSVITGSSKGIGLSLVHLLLEKGHLVAGISRSNTPIKHPNFKQFKADVSNEIEVSRAFQDIVTHFNQEVDWLVNNAGYGKMNVLEKVSSKEWKDMFDVNVHGVMYCSRSVIASMKQRKTGHIINISSIAGLQGVASMGAYCATKHAVKGFSHALFNEVRDFGVRVSCVYPGSIQTNFFDDIPAFEVHDQMMQAQDVSATILHMLESKNNYHVVDIEIRPLVRKK